MHSVTGAERNSTGIVVIGRDLGQRLLLCLRSLVSIGPQVIYVDSRSMDGSDRAAIDLGVPTIRLDASTPLNASRARNEGFAHLIRESPSIEFVQFVDGDCELEPDWLSHALDEMRKDSSLGIVCGHVREKTAGQSVAATLLDVEWRGPVGNVDACGGIFLVRVAAFVAAGGFSTEMQTGEEAEMCGRLRAGGWAIRRIDRAMCAHDADMNSVREWLRRSVRVGRGYAKSAALRGVSRAPSMRRKVVAVLFWALALPLLAIVGGLGALWRPIAWVIPVAVLLLYLIQIGRVTWRQRRLGRNLREALTYGFYNLVAKWAQLLGIMEHWLRLGTR